MEEIIECMSEAKQIYERLQDSESKLIFRERILFSITNDVIHIQNVIKTIDEGVWFDKITSGDEPRFIWGAGSSGKEIVAAWPGRWSGFLDSNEKKWGTTCAGLNVYKPEEILKKDFKGKIFISSRLYYEEIYTQIRTTGIEDSCIINIGELLEQLARKQYFSLSVLPHMENEVFADVGSLDGMSAKCFIGWCGSNNFRKVYCFEPDKSNAVKCEKNLHHYIELGKAKIVEKGAWSARAKLCFDSNRNGSSHIDLDARNSDEFIEVIDLDSVFESEKETCTFIKMDIEGAELEALMGCKEIICRDKPKLAICIYHKPEDIITIASKILEYNREYKIYMRHYSVRAAETVLYAI